jgi:hypothetical protein
MANTETPVVEEPTTAEQAVPEQTPPSLTLQDLILVAQIIQLTSSRGAFKAEELQNVGVLYNKLIAFLDSVGAITKPETAETGETK